MAKKFTTVLKEMDAARRRQERDRLVQERHAARVAATAEKLEQIHSATAEVNEHEATVNRLITLHKNCTAPVEWQTLANLRPPSEPETIETRTRLAQENLDTFKPSFQDKMLRRVDTKREVLSSELKLAKEEDSREFEIAMTTYQSEHTSWEEDKALAERILSADKDSYADAIERFGTFSDLGLYLYASWLDEEFATVDLYVDQEDVMPNEAVKMLARGGLSRKPLPKSTFFALYQDYVCGATFRVAREFFAVLPLQKILVTAVKDVLNMKTGHFETQPVLSVYMPRETISSLNFDLLDPSDALSNFTYNMKHLKTKGFSPTMRLDWEDFQ